VKILIADDDVLSRHLLTRQLTAWGYEVVTTRDGEEAWAILSGPDSPRLAVLDWVMPGFDGPELCKRVRAQAQEPYIYVVLLTAKDRREDVVAGLDAGADDYLSKPFNVPELKVRLRAAARIVSLQTELIAVRESLRFQATHDPLTGMRNRGAANQSLEDEVSRARGAGQSLAVAMVDLDHFKLINDTHGHPAGDAVLREAARRIASVVRPDDVVGRYGGEEFLVVLPGCSSLEAAVIGERIREALASRPITFGRIGVHVTGSVGVSAMARDHDVQRLVAGADAALYRAKRGGRDRVEIGAPSASASDPPSRRRSSRVPPMPEAAMVSAAGAR
jgi:two-component system cell cycle response regulator